MLLFILVVPSVVNRASQHRVLTLWENEPTDSNEIGGLLTSLSLLHYNDVIMGAMASQITSLTIVYSTVYSGTDQRKHQSSASLAFARGIHRGPVNFLHKGSVTRKMFPFNDAIMICIWHSTSTWRLVQERRNSSALAMALLEKQTCHLSGAGTSSTSWWVSARKT